jgi:hypothetical protein
MLKLWGGIADWLFGCFVDSECANLHNIMGYTARPIKFWHHVQVIHTQYGIILWKDVQTTLCSICCISCLSEFCSKQTILAVYMCKTLPIERERESQNMHESFKKTVLYDKINVQYMHISIRTIQNLSSHFFKVTLHFEH